MNEIDIMDMVSKQLAASLRWEYQAQHPEADIDHKDFRSFMAWQTKIVMGLLDLIPRAYEANKEMS